MPKHHHEEQQPTVADRQPAVATATAGASAGALQDAGTAVIDRILNGPLRDAARAQQWEQTLDLLVQCGARGITRLQEAQLWAPLVAHLGSTPRTPREVTALTQLFPQLPQYYQLQLFHAEFPGHVGAPNTRDDTSGVSPAQLASMYDEVVRLPRSQVRIASSIELNAQGNFYQEQTRTLQVATGFDGKSLGHEIGHSVDAALGAQSDALRSRFWQTHTLSEIIAIFGGPPALPAPEQSAVLDAVRIFFNASNAQASIHAFLASAAATHGVADPATFVARVENQPLVQLCARSVKPREWLALGGRRYTLNNYYKEGYSITEAAHAGVVAHHPLNALYAPGEWFAEMYTAWYGDVPRANFDPAVARFFSTVVDRMQERPGIAQSASRR